MDSTMKKVVLKLDLHDGKDKRKVMKAVSTLSGIDSLAVDMKDNKLTVTGEVDPVAVVGKLRKKQGYAEILSVGPAKEEKRKEGDNKGGENKAKGGDGNKKEAAAATDPIEAYKNHKYSPYLATHYHAMSVEENPNACVIS